MQDNHLTVIDLPQATLHAAIVGARRARQGTGEYVARELAALGCTVGAIVGTTSGTTDTARRTLAERYGITCRGYTSLARLLEAEDVQVVVVCSPPEVHLEHVGVGGGRLGAVGDQLDPWRKRRPVGLRQGQSVDW